MAGGPPSADVSDNAAFLSLFSGSFGSWTLQRWWTLSCSTQPGESKDSSWWEHTGKIIKEINKKPFHSFTLTFSAASLQTALALLHLRISEDKITYVLFSPVNYLCRRVRQASRDVCRRNKTGCQCSRQSGSSPSAPLRVGDIDWHNMPRGVRVCVCVYSTCQDTHKQSVCVYDKRF